MNNRQLDQLIASCRLTDEEAQEVAQAFNRGIMAVEEVRHSLAPQLMTGWRQFEQILVDLKLARWRTNDQL